MSDRKTTALIVTFNSRRTIDSCLASMRRSFEQELLACVVVDNASIDGTAEFVLAKHPWVKLIENKENIGFGRACNRAFQYVRTPYVLLLNPDAVLEPGALFTLINFMDSRPAAGIAGPAIRSPGGPLQRADRMQTPWNIIATAAGVESVSSKPRPVYPGQPPFETNWLCGAIMMIRSELFANLKGFDSRFFLYFEETDLCRRAAMLGAELWAVGEAVANHSASASARLTGSVMYGNCIAKHYFESRFYYMVKHYGWFIAICVDAAEVSLLAARAAIKRSLGRAGEVGLRERLRAPFCRLPASINGV